MQRKKQTNFSRKRVASVRPSNDVPVRALTGSIFVREFLKSFKKFEAEYHAQLKGENIKRAVELRTFQVKFWQQKATEVHLENAKVLDWMKKSRAKLKPDAIKKCEERIFQFVAMLRLLNRDIRAAIVQQSAKQSELTVLIAVEAIQKYRCRKYLKEWMATTSGDRRAITTPEISRATTPSGSRRATTEGSNDPNRLLTPQQNIHASEAQILHHVCKFIRLVFEHSKRAQAQGRG